MSCRFIQQRQRTKIDRIITFPDRIMRIFSSLLLIVVNQTCSIINYVVGTIVNYSLRRVISSVIFVLFA